MLWQQKRPPIQPSPCSDEKISMQRCRQHSACAVHCSVKIGHAIRRKSLQALQQHRESRDGSPDHERPRPSEADHQREREIANDVVNLPTEPRTELQFRGAKGGKYEQQDQDGHAANFCHRFNRHFVQRLLELRERLG
jgi:hypothetical protein